GDFVLEIRTGLDLDTRPGVIVHNIFQSQQSMHSLEMVRQTVIGAVEVEPFVFNSCPEIPLPGDEEAMSVAKAIVERIAVAALAVVVEETAIACVVQFVIKKLAVIFVRWCGSRLSCLICRRACDGGGGCAGEDA